LKRSGYVFQILFLEADDRTLLQRYSQTRRHHPLSKERSLKESIRTEREQLEELRKAADKTIDTSRCNVHRLKSLIFEIVQRNAEGRSIHIRILSFGYKYGIPEDADLMMDVRFLANPYFVPELKAMDGERDEIRRFVLKNSAARTFLDKYLDLIDFLLPLYEGEGKAYLTIAIGCTGGRHRSVVISQYVYEHIKKKGKRIELTHRDINQEAPRAPQESARGFL
jgi:UPF0042 nucleotide-binding protein